MSTLFCEWSNIFIFANIYFRKESVYYRRRQSVDDSFTILLNQVLIVLDLSTIVLYWSTPPIKILHYVKRTVIGHKIECVHNMLPSRPDGGWSLVMTRASAFYYNVIQSTLITLIGLHMGHVTIFLWTLKCQSLRAFVYVSKTLSPSVFEVDLTRSVFC